MQADTARTLMPSADPPLKPSQPIHNRGRPHHDVDRVVVHALFNYARIPMIPRVVHVDKSVEKGVSGNSRAGTNMNSGTPSEV